MGQNLALEEILKSLYADRAEIERQLASLSSVQQRHAHLLSAIVALEKLARTYAAAQETTQAAFESSMGALDASMGAIKASIGGQQILETASQQMAAVQRASESTAALRESIESTRAVQEAMGSTREMEAALQSARNVMRGPLQLMQTIRSVSGLLEMRMRQKPRTLPEAAEQVLAEAGRPLHVKELVAGIQAKGLSAEKKFEQVRTSLVPSLNRKSAKGDTFWKDPESPIYGLLAWQKQEGEQEALL